MEEIKLTKEALQRSEAEFKALADNAPIMIIRINKEGIIKYINRVQVGYKLEDVVGTPVYNYILPEHHDIYQSSIQSVLSNFKPVFFEIIVPGAESGFYWYDVHMAPIITNDNIEGIVVLTTDVSEKKKAKEKMEKLLKEKEILLKEVHHRAKNNLQIVSSILNLHTGKTDTQEIIDVLNECKNSIQSLATVHECLYKSDNFSSIDFSDYLSRFCNHFQKTINPNTRVQLSLNLNSVSINMDRAVTCGLIVNELLINCYKHAFPNNQKGNITIDLETLEETVNLKIKDDGIGLPQNLDIKNANTLGLELIQILAEQLNGSLEHTSSKNIGTIFSLSFKQNKEN